MKNSILALCMLALGCEHASTTKPPAPATNKWSDARLASVLDAQDHRDSKALLVLLTDTADAVREAAAMAFISVQDTSVRAGLAAAMHDTQPTVRLAAAWALSFVADTNAVKAIADQALKETDPTMASAFYAASFRALTKTKPQLEPQELFSAFVKSDGYQRVCIAEALRRLPKETLVPVERRYIELLQREMQPESKMLLLAGMKNFSDTLARKVVSGMLNDPDPMIRVAALRAHAAIAGKGAIDELFQALYDSFPAVRSTAVELLKTMDEVDVGACLKAAEKITDTKLKIPLYGLAAKSGNATTRDRAGAALEILWSKERDPYTRVALIEAKSLFVPVDTLIFWMEQAWSAVERQAAFAGAVEQVVHASDAQRNKVLRAAFGTNDPGLIAAAAEELVGSDTTAIGMVLDNTVEQQVRSALHPIRDLETLQLLDLVVAKRNGSPPPPHQAPIYNHPINRARLASLKEGKEYRITTTKGDIVIAIEPNTAPGTCTAFDSLVTSGFYNGKYFHRIVPDFVAQGGCPRGDGFGAMDWTMRTENGYAGFVTGAVGIASAGRDTESCQFFIMLAPAPHLDGRYTRFAHVVSGMDVAQRLVIGDAMSRVEQMP
ncbi:MAG: peptidylprolyl isomerase [Flavobacteriales bacterium]|nr:peptidylprolyl isomerase [Flavobacteriales bacterium]